MHSFVREEHSNVIYRPGDNNLRAIYGRLPDVARAAAINALAVLQVCVIWLPESACNRVLHTNVASRQRQPASHHIFIVFIFY